MLSRVFEIFLPMDFLTLNTFKKIKEITGADKLEVKKNAIIIQLPVNMGTSTLSTFSTKISYELGLEEIQLSQNTTVFSVTLI